MLPSLSVEAFLQQNVAPCKTSLPLRQVQLPSGWDQIQQQPQLLTDLCQWFVNWLPPTTRQALFDELNSGQNLASKESVLSKPSSRKRGRAAPQGHQKDQLLLKGNKTQKDLLTPTVDSKERFLLINSDATAGLHYLAVLLYPLFSDNTLSDAISQRTTTTRQQLELICTLLLPHKFRELLFHTSTSRSSMGVCASAFEAPMWADMQARAVAASLRHWVSYFEAFFLDQLHREHVRVAALTATVGHLRHLSQPPATPGDSETQSFTGVLTKGNVEAQQRQQQQGKRDALAFLRRYSHLQRQHPAHYFAQKVGDHARRILADERGSASQNSGAASATRAAAETASPRSLKSEHRKLSAKTSQHTRTRRSAPMTGKRAAGGQRFASPLKKRRRGFGREDSSDSTTSFDSASTESTSSSASALPAAAEARNAHDDVEAAAPLSDSDVPLATLVSRKRRLN